MGDDDHIPFNIIEAFLLNLNFALNFDKRYYIQKSFRFILVLKSM